MCIIGHHGNAFTSFGAVTAVGGWVELDRTTLGSAADVITVSSLADKRYYMVLADLQDTGGNTNQNLTLNNITTGTYARRRSNDGAADSTDVSASSIDVLGDSADEKLIVSYWANLSGKEKISIGHIVRGSTAGAGTAPGRNEYVAKHAQTSNPISRFDYTNTGAGSYNTGSEVVVLGWDPADTHTTNFWEELASADLSGGASDTISSGTFTAKKYLWIQFFLESSGTVQDGFRVGNGSVDTGSNYAYRNSVNGGTDSTSVNQTDIGDFSNISNNQFCNFFIVNNASNEKLIIAHYNEGKTGAGSAPTRIELAAKWTNTSNQINIVEMRNVAGGGDYGTKTIVKVWGSN